MKKPVINSETISLIKEFEGLRLNAYLDPVGIPTIGYGLTTGALDGVVVRMGMTITEQEADEFLRRVVEKFSDDIWTHFKRQPTENQFGAMVSLAYNIGTGAFRKSTALRRFNAGDIEGAAEAMKWFNKAGGRTLRGLVRRRAAEVKLFLTEPTEEQSVVISAKSPIEENVPAVHPKVKEVVEDADKSPSKSTTNWSQIGQAIGSIGLPGILSAFGQMDWKVAVPIMIISAGAISYVLYERRRKTRLSQKAKEVM